MKTLLISIALLLSLSEAAHARTHLSQSQQTYLSEMTAILKAQAVKADVLETGKDYLLAIGRMYCVYKEEKRLFHLYGQTSLDHLKRQEENLIGHPRAQELYKFYALVQIIHKSPADRNLCPSD